jgi:hypothetical protein
LATSAPSVPTGLSTSGSIFSNYLTWTPGSGGGAPSKYNIYAIHGSTGSFGSAVLVGTSTSTFFTHTGLSSSDTWRYWVTAENFVGESTEDGPINSTTSSTGGGIPEAPIDGTTYGRKNAGWVAVTGGGGGGGFTVVYDQILSVAAALVNIPSIPQGFTDLRLIIEAGRTASGNDFCAVLLNSDNTAGHYYSYVENRFGFATYNNLMRWGSMENAGSDYAISDGWIFDYSSTTRHKRSLSQGSYTISNFIDRNASVWFDNTAVTSMDVIAGSSTFAVGTRIRLLAI